jgi:acylphosphatase
MKRISISLEGDVQGVGFRWSARARASQLGVSGFARNEDDGSVYIEAEGPDAAVDRFLEWCRRGPVSATVTRVTVRNGQCKGLPGFAIEG